MKDISRYGSYMITELYELYGFIMLFSFLASLMFSVHMSNSTCRPNNPGHRMIIHLKKMHNNSHLVLRFSPDYVFILKLKILFDMTN